MKSQNNLLFHVSAEDLKKIPGSPIAYWVSKQLKKCYDHDLISSIAFSDGQILTGNNDKYLRLLWEVDKNAILNHNWVLHAKGGEFRRWYGNIDSVVRFDPDTIAHYKKDPISRFPKEDILFRKGVTWSLVSSNPSFGVRFLDDSLTFNKAAATILFRDETFILYILGFLNTIIAQVILRIINPTINNNIKDVLSIPFFWEDSKKNEIESLVQKCIHFSSDDWNAYETSWEFQANPLVKEVALCKKMTVIFPSRKFISACGSNGKNKQKKCAVLKLKTTDYSLIFMACRTSFRRMFPGMKSP